MKNNPCILIVGGDVAGNKGAAAMTQKLIDELSARIPRLKFIITSLSVDDYYEETSSYSKEVINIEGLRLDMSLLKIWLWWILKFFGFNKQKLPADKLIAAFNVSDIVISAAGISFYESFGYRQIYQGTKPLQIALLLNKPLVLYTQSLGPFKLKYNRQIAPLILKSANLVMARGEISYQQAISIGVQDNLTKFPDIAIGLSTQKPTNYKEIEQKLEGKNIIGIAPNFVCTKLDKDNRYIPAYVAMANYLLAKTDATLLFIPHTISNKNPGREDDLYLCREIIQLVSGDSSRILLEELTHFKPEEVKWLISTCKFTICSRFHALIAALSLSIPSISVGWHWKYQETMDWYQLGGNLLQIWELSSDKAIDLLQKNYSKISEEKAHLQNRNIELKKMIDESINLIYNTLDEKAK